MLVCYFIDIGMTRNERCYKIALAGFYCIKLVFQIAQEKYETSGISLTISLSLLSHTHNFLCLQILYFSSLSSSYRL